jgi:hypothetical protein
MSFPKTAVHDPGEARAGGAGGAGGRGAWRQLCLSPVCDGAPGGEHDARGQLGRLFASHGSYLQDWMLLETDYNWRVDAALGGASRAVADIGSHWCDTVQFVTGGALPR